MVKIIMKGTDIWRRICFSLIAAERSGAMGNFHVGGFAGYIGQYSELSNCRSLAGSVSAHSGQILVTGGFVGVLGTASLDGCYAVTDVFSTGTGLGLGQR
jgi:hypothetical protein